MRPSLICGLLVSGGWVLGAPPGSPDTGPQTVLQSALASGTLPSLRWPNFSPSKGDVSNFYQSTAYQLAWVRDSAATRQAKAMIQILENAGAKGLDPEDYDARRWPGRLLRLRPDCPRPSDSDLADFDLALTVSSIRYISAVRTGRVNPQVFCFGLDVVQKECNEAEVLRRAMTAGDVRAVLEELDPPLAAYRRTEQALQKYLALARDDDGELLPATRKPVDPGDTYPGIARLERLLRRLGDLPREAAPSPASQRYEGPLVEAVKHFQNRHGLDPDGRIGKSTLKQFNTPLARRVRQLQLALERWRWIPTSFRRPPIVVNIPEFRLRALNQRYETELEMKVVVGGAYRHQTPVFADEMTHLIFRPYWNVPLSIQRAELVPQIAKDHSYLAKNDYQITDSRGHVVSSEVVTPEMLAQLRSGKLAVRQMPGVKNALGFVKFVFPNQYNVYLHGTPAQALFSRSRRDFSHGCIRVERPEELALWVLKDCPEWTLERIREAEAGEKTQPVNLDRPIPVLIVYGTAVVSENGQVSFYEDIYGHDASLEHVLAQGYPYSGWQPPPPRGGQRPPALSAEP